MSNQPFDCVLNEIGPVRSITYQTKLQNFWFKPNQACSVKVNAAPRGRRDKPSQNFYQTKYFQVCCSTCAERPWSTSTRPAQTDKQTRRTTQTSGYDSQGNQVVDRQTDRQTDRRKLQYTHSVHGQCGESFKGDKIKSHDWHLGPIKTRFGKRAADQ